MISISSKTVARAIGASIGLAIALAWLVAARPDAHMPASPASVRFTAASTGELEMAPATVTIASRDLVPGAAGASGSFRVRNQTGSTLDVALRAEGDPGPLDGLLRVRVGSSGGVLLDSTLQGLRAGTPSALVLRSGESADVRLQAWLPREVTSGYQARHEAVEISPVVSVEGER